MKRLLAALAALCLLASSASAKGLVIVASTANNNANFANGMRPLENMFVSTLRGLGANFDVIRAEDLNGSNLAFNAQVDSYLRHGKIWRNKMGAVSLAGDSMVTTYNPIIHLGFSGSDANYPSGGTSTTKYRPDSLTLVAYYPTVTHLFVSNPNHSANEFATTARCSTGVGAKTSYSISHDSTYNAYEVGNPGRTWKSYVRFLVNGTRSTRGWRPILGSISTRHESPGEASNNYDNPCASCSYSTNPDSIGGLWVINNTDAAGRPIGGNAKPMIFCSPARLFTASDFDMGNVLTAIALADSFSGGGLLSGSTKTPAMLGIHIDDGWKRGDSNGGSGGGGIALSDTTALKASIDSLAALNVPMVVGVECDSLGTGVWSDSTITYYACYNLAGSRNVLHTAMGDKKFSRLSAGMLSSLVDANGTMLTVLSVGADSTVTLSGDATSLAASAGSFVSFAGPNQTTGNAALMDFKWWTRYPQFHFTPHCHAGISGTFYKTPPNTMTKYLRTIDLWGINLNRTAFGSVDSMLAYGLPDYANEANDEQATYWLSKRAFALLDSMVGSSRVDHLIMPPADDWTNSRINHSGTGTGNTVDSVMAAVALSGGTAVRSNAFSQNSSVVQNATSNTGYGYYINQQAWALRASGVPTWVPVALYGTPCNVLSCPGYQNTTNSVDPAKGVGSARSWSSAVRGQIGNYSNTLRGLFGGPMDEQQWTGSATMGQNVKVSIQALHVGDLGSRQPATGGELTRPGFYNLKYMVHSVNLANAHARQPLIVFAYPDQMVP